MREQIIRTLSVIGVLTGLTGTGFAAPERIMIKDAQQKTKERTAAAKVKTMDLRDIEDPAARKAIQEIMNYLGLRSKK